MSGALTAGSMNGMSDRPAAAAEITRLLVSLREGEREAADRLLPLVYGELRAMARRRLAPRSAGHTLDTTGLVHEVYLRLFDQTQLEWRDRRHFYAVVAMAMRQIVVDHARRRLAGKRGGGQDRVGLDMAEVASGDRIAEVLEVHEALAKLKALDERLASIVEMRYFAGFSVEETAEMLGLTERTVKRDWRKARALLFEELRWGRPDEKR
jgi:RNA polymerase sigma factor (TIGR02999 family)